LRSGETVILAFPCRQEKMRFGVKKASVSDRNVFHVSDLHRFARTGQQRNSGAIKCRRQRIGRGISQPALVRVSYNKLLPSIFAKFAKWDI
jgi:hypothetical protein